MAKKKNKKRKSSTGYRHKARQQEIKKSLIPLDIRNPFLYDYQKKVKKNRLPSAFGSLTLTSRNNKLGGLNDRRILQNNRRDKRNKRFKEISPFVDVQDSVRDICTSRKNRREVLFAHRKAGRGKKIKGIRKLTADSFIKC